MGPAGKLRWIALAACALVTVATLEPARAGTLVNFNFTGFGNVEIDLFDDLVSTTVNNFVQNYVSTGAFNATMVHRVDTGLGVIQGGGYLASNGAAIATAAPIPLEYNRANTRGTISMARLGVANTATATSQWFINTGDNTTNLGQANGGGYAVFGWVVGPGMSVVDAIAAVPTINYQGVPAAWAQSWGLQNSDVLTQWPLQNFTVTQAQNGENPLPHDVVLNSATVVKTHASYQNPFLADDVNNSGGLNATDALTIINELLVHGSHTLNTPFAGTNYLDVDGNGRVNSTDALTVIHDLLSHPAQQQATQLAAGASPMLVVPEPSTLALGGMLAIGLAAAAARAGKARRKRSSRVLQWQTASVY